MSRQLADKYRLKSIAFPYISTGIYRYPKKEAKIVAAAANALHDFYNDYPETSIAHTYLAEYNE